MAIPGPSCPGPRSSTNEAIPPGAGRAQEQKSKTGHHGIHERHEKKRKKKNTPTSLKRQRRSVVVLRWRFRLVGFFHATGIFGRLALVVGGPVLALARGGDVGHLAVLGDRAASDGVAGLVEL